MSAAAVAAVAAPVGAVVGLAVGWLCVLLEKVERLKEEDREDRAAYEHDVAAARIAAAESGEAPPPDEPWNAERYGWTWLERVLCPILGAAGYTAFAVHEPFGKDLVIHLLWLTLFVQVVSFDLKHRLILNRVTYPAMVVALALATVSPGLDIWRALGGLIAVGLFFVVQNVVSRGGIGLGDAKLGALVGAICGLGLDLNHIGAVYAVIYAIFLGGAVALLLLVLRVRSLKDPIPYGPFLCIGASLMLFRGL